MVLLEKVKYNDIVKNTPPLGPAPTPAPDETLAPDVPRARVLRAVEDLGGRASVAEIAATLGGHPNTTRHHLRILLDEGLVRVEPAEPPSARGRPTLRYAVSASGRRALAPRHGEPDAAQYLALAGAFADRLAAIGGDPRGDSRAIGRAWASVLTGPSAGWAPSPEAGHRPDPPPGPEPRQGVLTLLERLGFSPEEGASGPDGTAGSDTPDVLLRTCPLLEAATRHPEVVCEVHAGLVAGAHAAHGGSGEGVLLEPFALPGACRLTLPPSR